MNGLIFIDVQTQGQGTMEQEKDIATLGQVEVDTTLAQAADKATISNSVLNRAALEGTADEHELDVLAALKAYPYAVGWALVSATCVIMEGYDTNLLSNFFAYRMCLSSWGPFC